MTANTKTSNPGHPPAIYETCTSLPFGDGLSCSSSDPSPMHFTGKERDSESGLDNFGARYYASTFGRFASPDELLADQNRSNPQSWNLYNYVRDNPLYNTDPDGRTCTKDANGNFTGDTCDQNTETGTTPDRIVVKPEAPPLITHIDWPWLHPVQSESERKFHLWLAAHGAKEVRAEIPFLFGPVGSLSAAAEAAELSYMARLSGILREAAAGKGNFGIGEASAGEAAELGDAWVGPGARTASDGVTKVSADGLRVYRPPSFKPSFGKVQANLEQKAVPGGQPISNGHLDIK
jgi:RHS repeat-associated protein